MFKIFYKYPSYFHIFHVGLILIFFSVSNLKLLYSLNTLSLWLMEKNIHFPKNMENEVSLSEIVGSQLALPIYEDVRTSIIH